MSNSIAQTIAPEVKDLGGFEVRRILPHLDRQMVGPFIFVDHIGPAVFAPGHGIDVRPHPHINLATVTYLFEGVIMHRDSLNSVQEIQPGAVNWMTAGRGIVHSERTPEKIRQNEARLHGIQTWIALPQEHEETDPWFCHYAAADIPAWQENGVSIKLIAGKANGYTSPVKTFSPMVYLDVQFSAQSSFRLDDSYTELAVYPLTSGLVVDGISLEPNQMVILTSDRKVEISANQSAHCMIFGGEPVGKRYKWWNFVSSSLERIEQAKSDWKSDKFDRVPLESEFIPLPDQAS